MGNVRKEYRSQYFMNMKLFNTVSKKKIQIKIRMMLLFISLTKMWSWKLFNQQWGTFFGKFWVAASPRNYFSCLDEVGYRFVSDLAKCPASSMYFHGG